MSSKPNWLDLPSDVISNILHRLGAIAILQNAQRVCTTWYNICKDPAMWRVIDMQKSENLYDTKLLKYYDLIKMCKHAVDRSQGQLLEITIDHFAEIKLLHYIANRSSKLRCLRLSWLYYCEGFGKVLKKLPLLEELSLSLTFISYEAIEFAGQYCPLLKTLKINGHGYRMRLDEDAPVIYNEQPVAIAKNFPKLLHLQLIGYSMNNIGLEAILDGCPHLESLDLRKCLNIRLAGDLGIRCSQQIKYLRLPRDSLEDYKYNADVFSPCPSCGVGMRSSWNNGDYDEFSNCESDNFPIDDDLTNYDGDSTKFEESNNDDDFPRVEDSSIYDDFPKFEDTDDWENFKVMFEMSYKIKTKEKKEHFRKVLSKRKKKTLRKVVSKWKKMAMLDQFYKKKKERKRGHFLEFLIDPKF